MLNKPIRADIAGYVTKRTLAGRDTDKRTVPKKARDLRSDQVARLSTDPGQRRAKKMRFARQSLGADEPALLVIIKGEFQFGLSRLVHHDQRTFVLAGRLPCLDQL